VSEVPFDLRVIAERVTEVVNRKLAEVDRKYSERVEALEKKVGVLEVELAAVRTGFVKDVVKSVIDAKVEEAVVSAVKNASGFLISDLDARIKGIAEGLSVLSKNVSDLRDTVIVARSEAEKSMEAMGKAIIKSIDSLQSTINGLVVAINELRDLLKKFTEVINAVDTKTTGILERVEDMNVVIKDVATRLTFSSAPVKPPEEGVG
jgi:uncharacterized phage infection (PIP) family protein YhgE